MSGLGVDPHWPPDLIDSNTHQNLTLGMKTCDLYLAVTVACGNSVICDSVCLSVGRSGWLAGRLAGWQAPLVGRQALSR